MGRRMSEREDDEARCPHHTLFKTKDGWFCGDCSRQSGLVVTDIDALAAHVEAVRVSERVRLAEEVERGDGLEAMCDRLAGSHVDLQDAVAWALNEAVAWRDRMPRTRENDTYPNGRQDGVDVVVRVVKAAVSAHLRGEDPAALVPVPGVRLTEEE